MSAGRADLARAYEQAVYVAELPQGRVEFRLHQRPDGPVPSAPLAIITAWNPGTDRPNVLQNAAANRQLEAALQAAGWRYWSACGRSEDGSHREPSFAVMDAAEESILELARAFGQAAVFYWDGIKARLIWCDE